MICLTFPENGGNSDDKLFTKKQKKAVFISSQHSFFHKVSSKLISKMYALTNF